MQPLLFDMAMPDVPETVGRADVGKARARHLLTPGKGRLASYDFVINPYVGCSFGCSYCYAAFFVEGTKRDTWGSWVETKEDATGSIRPAMVRGKSIYLSSATDAYQPLEEKVRFTRAIVDVLARSQARLVVQTRSPLVTRDIDLFRKFDHVRVNVSITTDDDNVRKRYEPNCASIERRIAAVQQLVEAGIKVNVCISPMLPMSDPIAFAQRIQDIGVHALTTSYFHDDVRSYAANTREMARNLAAEDDWNESRFQFARFQIRSIFPDDRRAFSPE